MRPACYNTALTVVVCLSVLLVRRIALYTTSNRFLPLSTNDRDLSPLSDELTVVTAYFNIGKFSKGEASNFFTPDMYSKWMSVFALIESPVIGYFDSDSHIDLFKQLRANLPSNLTVIRRINRTTMWSFGLEPEIARIFAKPKYPRHYPNTVVALYSAAMHAKYEVMRSAVDENPFRTRYFCWLDVGLFRSMTLQPAANATRFSLHLPPGFRQDSIAYQDVLGRTPEATVHNIVYDNMVWVCGCFFVGEVTVMRRWVDEYKTAVRRLIDQHGLMSTDQQVIYAAFNTMTPNTTIQTYKADGRYNEWFHLGYVSRDAGLARRQQRLIGASTQRTSR